jgi:hypothetical protein
MKSSDVLEQLLNEQFSFGVITVAMFAREVNRTKPVEIEHLDNDGSYENEIVDHVKDVMWAEDGLDVEMGIDVWKVLYDYEIMIALDGLGGCKRKSIRELLEENSK